MVEQLEHIPQKRISWGGMAFLAVVLAGLVYAGVMINRWFR